MKQEFFADIILPLAVKGYYTYRVTEQLTGNILPGVRAIVSFGKKKLYTGIVRRVYSEKPYFAGLKDIIDVIDDSAVVDELQLNFWEWIAEYYMCYPGEVMKAALPPNFLPESETLLQVNIDSEPAEDIGDRYIQMINLIERKREAKLKDLIPVFGNREAMQMVNYLISRNLLVAGEKIHLRAIRKTEKYIVLTHDYTTDELEALLDSLKKAPKQYNLLHSYIRLSGYSPGRPIIPVRKALLLKESGSSISSMMSLQKKGILVSVDSGNQGETTVDEPLALPLPLSEAQMHAFISIKEQIGKKGVILLHGVTSSGKTEIYIHLIKEYLDKGSQVLYLLPEIALTAQIVERLKKHFGKSVGVYHSRLSNTDKLKLREKIRENNPEERCNLILGVRSALFLPFRDLKMIIIDEEHDSSYKQQDPAPRYHARDSAIMLASMWGATTILGSATPSIESYYNASTGKYGYTELKVRFGKVNLPEIVLVNTRDAYRKKLMTSHFSPQLIEAVGHALKNHEQVMLFRNRRGFAPYLQCNQCGWIPQCNRCSVNLTYHRESNRLVCHYCGLTTTIVTKCPQCGSLEIETRGFGTEKIEDEIKLLFPDARVARMDYDTTRKQGAFNLIIKDFEDHKIDILVGTQMISKGLDFENLSVVGILNADTLLNFPDFRSYERAFQLMSQVSGRAGRRKKAGKVIVQTSEPDHRILRQVLRNDYKTFYQNQIEERKIFNYPPFCRLIKITIRHKDINLLKQISEEFASKLRQHFGNRILGPQVPVISRIQLWHIMEILVKIEKDKPVNKAKDIIREVIEGVSLIKGGAQAKISADVDPY